MNSIGKIYIDCPEQEKKGAFEVKKELTEEEYVKMLRDYSTSIGAGFIQKNNFDKKYGFYDNFKNDELNYIDAKCEIYDISGKLCNIKELYRIQRTQNAGVIIINIDTTTMNENFESEFRFWKKDSMNINNNKNINKNDRIRFLPKRELKFEIDNHMFLFSGSKIYCEYEEFKVALIIEKITEI